MLFGAHSLLLRVVLDQFGFERLFVVIAICQRRPGQFCRRRRLGRLLLFCQLGFQFADLAGLLLVCLAQLLDPYGRGLVVFFLLRWRFLANGDKYLFIFI